MTWIEVSSVGNRCSQYTKSRGQSSTDNKDFQRTLAAFEALGTKKHLEDIQRLLSES